MYLASILASPEFTRDAVSNDVEQVAFTSLVNRAGMKGSILRVRGEKGHVSAGGYLEGGALTSSLGTV